uniref:Transmembrane protein n=1 Tax=Panagrellus redivivus TaxID=6233 RepID=A0A7E4W057_PANRE
MICRWRRSFESVLIVQRNHPFLFGVHLRRFLRPFRRQNGRVHCGRPFPRLLGLLRGVWNLAQLSLFHLNMSTHSLLLLYLLLAVPVLRLLLLLAVRALRLLLLLGAHADNPL